MTNFNKVLMMAKEVREETDVKIVASLLATKEWVVIGAVVQKDQTIFSIIRIV